MLPSLLILCSLAAPAPIPKAVSPVGIHYRCVKMENGSSWREGIIINSDGTFHGCQDGKFWRGYWDITPHPHRHKWAVITLNDYDLNKGESWTLHRHGSSYRFSGWNYQPLSTNER